MRISKIELCNFGSYAGVNTFCIGDEVTDKKIVLIGGKNGAGKTTLFSGIKLCLYGYKAEGFDGANSHYKREIKKFFNDIGKYESDFKCYVKVDCLLSNGHSDDYYEIKREWHAKAKKLSEFESVSVKKNGKLLNDEGLSDFENFLLSIIPPELFNLFFFDGEQIADYFLAEGENQRIKNAFMVLCGFDTLNIMEKNFRRLVYSRKNTDNNLQKSFFEHKDQLKKQMIELNAEEEKLEDVSNQIEHIDYEIDEIENKYKLSGGVTLEEWSEKLQIIKEEEVFREEKNAFLKRMANEEIPFIIVRDQLLVLMKQVEDEREKQKMELLQNSVRSILPDIMRKVQNKVDGLDGEATRFILEELNNELKKNNINEIKCILNLSDKDFSSLQSMINYCISFDKQEIIKAEKDIKKSLRRSQKAREFFDNSSIGGLQNYLEEKKSLLEEKDALTSRWEERTQKVTLLKQEIAVVEEIVKREEKKFEEEIKKQSVLSLSEKAIVFLDALQDELFNEKIHEVQKRFMEKIRILARKKNFIDKIVIDKNFAIHIYKNVEFDTAQVCAKISEMGCGAYIEEYGMTHCSGILDATQTHTLEEFYQSFRDHNEEFSILQEIDKSRLSKGEKQIFIMALYWAIMSLCKYEVPFIIDTPFARIDTEHRTNITENFFMNLRGQVFIFSTNEEITEKHFSLMEKQVQAKFMLENNDNVSTKIIYNSFFGKGKNAI